MLVRGSPARLAPVRRALRDLATDIEIAAAEEISAPISLLVLSCDQFKEFRRRERRIALDIDTKGVPL